MAEFSTVRGTRLRVTRTDECCSPATGAGDSVVTSGFITVNYSPELRDRDEIETINAGGEICVSDTIAPQLKWYNLEIEFCKVSPDLFGLLTGQTVVDDFDMESVGVTIGESPTTEGFALEVWTKIPGEACTAGSVPYGYFLIPCAGEGVFSDFTIENDSVTFTITGRSLAPNDWGSGPYDVVASDSGGTPSPLLDPLATDDHLHLQKTTIEPPAVS